jgi:dUTPase
VTILGPKINFPHRHLAVVDTGLEVRTEEKFKLCFKLTPSLASRGMVATNAPGNIKAGKVSVVLLNCGREIVELKDGDPLVEVWLEADQDFDWEEDSEG